MTTLNEILTAVQALPAADRAQLLVALWDNVDPSDWVPPDPEWIAEANKRSAAYEAGEMIGSTWSEVRERARRRAKLDG